MRILAILIIFGFICSCVSVSSVNSAQKSVKKNKLYLYEDTICYIKLTLRIDSSFILIKETYNDHTGSFSCNADGTYLLKGDSILLNFENSAKGRYVDAPLELFSNSIIKGSFSECEIKLLKLDFKNIFCE